MEEKKDNMERPEEEREAMTEPNEQEMVPTVIQDTETKTEEPKEDVSYDYGRCSKSGSEEMADRQDKKKESGYTAYSENVQQESQKNARYDSNYAYNVKMDPKHEPDAGLDSSPLSMGDWLLTILALLIPCCGGIILYCYWAFSKTGNLNRRNFCRAALIVEAVCIVIALVFIILVGVIGFADSYIDYNGYYYGY